MSTLDRDPVVAEALGAIPVPDHRPGFWDALDARLDSERRLSADPTDDGREVRVPTSELPVITALHIEPAVPRRHRMRFLAAAAAIAVVAVATGVALRGDGDGGGGEFAGRVATTSATTAVSSLAVPPGPDRPAAVPAPGAPTPRDAVVEWVGALAAGDEARAASLIGPLSLRYIAALGADPEGFMVESMEGYGAWAASPDRTIREVSIPGAGTVVVLGGTWTGEGGPLYRLEAIPTVQADDGSWFVEHLAFDPVAGGRPEIVRPAPTVEGWEGQAPDAVLEASSAYPGARFWFSLDGRPAVPDDDGEWDPPGGLANGTHLLVVAVVGDGLFGAAAGEFLVEG